MTKPVDTAAMPRARTRGRIPLGLVGMVALVSLVESYLGRHPLDYASSASASWRAVAHASGKAERVDLLFLGDSMVKFGLQPRVVRAATGWSAKNQAVYCGPAATSTFLLRRELERGARPRAVVVDFPPEFLAADSLGLQERVYPELLTVREASEMAARAGDASDWLARFFLASALPSVRARFEVRTRIGAALRGELEPNHAVRARVRNWDRNRGAEVLPGDSDHGDVIPDNGDFTAMFHAPWTPHPLNVVFLDEFLTIADREGIPVFWLIPPNIPAVEARRQAVGITPAYEAFVRSRVERFPGCVVLDARRGGFTPGLFVDPVHLDRAGAVALTLGVAEVVRDRLAADPGSSHLDRWVTVPARIDRPDLVDFLEDNLQSHFALLADPGRVVR